MDIVRGLRVFRTVVIKMDMGDPIQGYNGQLEHVTAGIHEALGLGGLLKLKV